MGFFQLFPAVGVLLGGDFLLQFFQAGSDLLDLLAKPVAYVAVVLRVPLFKVSLRGHVFLGGLTAWEERQGKQTGRDEETQVHRVNGSS